MAKIVGVIASALLVFSLAGCGDQIGDKYVMFAKCLTRKNIKMYGAYWCGHCQNQKAMFGPQGFAEINYIECDPRGDHAKPELCLQNGIDGYPTWIFPDGSRLKGEVSLEQLAQKSDCKLPSEQTGTSTSI